MDIGRHRVHFAIVACYHRKRITTEEKEKVVASVWGTEFIRLLAALAVLPGTT